MGEIAEPDTQSPATAVDALDGGHDGAAPESRGVKRARVSAAGGGDDDDDDDDKPGRERRKIDIKFIQDKSRRHITFSKRKAGIMKKVRERHNKPARTPRPSRIVAKAPTRSAKPRFGS